VNPPSRPQIGRSNWPKDFFGKSEVLTKFLPLLGLLILCILWASLHLLGSGGEAVVVYTSQDQVYAEPILREFTKQTGINVRALYDSEAVKTVGLANRLLVERSHPQCDLFWNNEELRTRQLAANGVFRETNAWAPVGFRSRRLVVNTNRVSLSSAPHSVQEITNEVWRGKVALAYPLFGTTVTHFLALRQSWGEANWQLWCRALQANKPFLVDGNSVAAQFVARGEAWIGLTDSDDIAAEQRDGAPIAALPLGPESLLIRNTVAVAAGARHPEAAQRLFEFLQRREIAQQLAAMNALEGISTSEVSTPTLEVKWDLLLDELEAGTETLKQIFLR